MRIHGSIIVKRIGNSFILIDYIVSSSEVKSKAAILGLHAVHKFPTDL